MDNRQRLTDILSSLKMVSETCKLPIVFPLHPRTMKQVKAFGLEKDLDAIKTLRKLPPVGYLSFVNLLCNARLVMTDSGGIQEESCIIHIPCVTLRENTERPETVEVGGNLIAGTARERVLAAVEAMLNLRFRNWENPFGAGRASTKIVDVLMNVSGQDGRA